MFIQTENTPNPATVKFLPGQTLTSGDPVDCPDADAAEHVSPLAERLFQLDGVNGVMIGAEAVSVTKAEDASWDVLKLQIMGVLMEHLSAGLPVVYEAAKSQDASAAPDANDSLASKVKMLIETRVRPVVARDGGDIVFERFEDGIVFLRMRGACAGCPSATITLKNGVENMLKTYVPEVVSVQQVL